MHRQIYRFLMLNNIITPSQSGFLPGESTTDQLLCIYENLYSNYDKRKKEKKRRKKESILILLRHLIVYSIEAFHSNQS